MRFMLAYYPRRFGMINLLPPGDRRQLVAARTNTLLLRYVVLLPILVAALIIEMGVLYFMMNAAQENSRRNIADNEARSLRFRGLSRR